MLSIRKVKTKSKSTAIQVVVYDGNKTKVIKHIGSGHGKKEIQILLEKAKEYIDNYSGQLSLFEQPASRIILVDKAECIAVTHQFARRFLLCCAKQCGLSDINKLLLDFSIMRLLFPASKQKTMQMLSHYFGINYSQRVYRNIPKLKELKPEIQKKAYQLATEKFKEQFYFVLYDVTTLYFETTKSDELRIPGFSKDNKPQQPQVVIGLLVTHSGFPLAYEIFPGNTFEGKTMLPIIEEFINKHENTKPIIVADAAMLSEARLEELKEKKISYIVGARLANCSLEMVKQIHNGLNKKDGAIVRTQSIHGELICDYSTKRYKKQLSDLNKQINKAEEYVLKQESGKKAKFVKKLSKDVLELNKALIEKHKLLLGIKGYCTDIPESQLSNQDVIVRYHNLWRVEQSFRMSKSDLQTRPIFHYKENAIRSHILICFTALIMEKYLELNTNLSLQKIKDLIWNVTETHIQDTITKEVFVFSSPLNLLIESPLAKLLKDWNLLPY